jgi:hypothetical protein
VEAFEAASEPVDGVVAQPVDVELCGEDGELDRDFPVIRTLTGYTEAERVVIVNGEVGASIVKVFSVSGL